MSAAYSYIRFSRPEQALGDSLRRQLEASRAYAKAHGLTLVEELSDKGKSAYRGKHVSEGALGRFLELVNSGEIEEGSTLLVESLDRLSRQEIDLALEQMLGIIRSGVRIVTLMDGQVYDRETIRSSPVPLIISVSVMSRAYEESRTKGERVASAWAEKRSLARSDMKAMTRACPEWLHIVEGRYQPIPERAAIIRRIFEETASGLGRRSIV